MRKEPIYVDANASWIGRWLIGPLAIILGALWVGMGITRWSSFWPVGAITLMLGTNAAFFWAWHVQKARWEHRLTSGKCPHCNYDRTGLAAGAGCPECGRAPR